MSTDACPACGASLGGASICPACDHIVDSAFLGAKALPLDDEATDPGAPSPLAQARSEAPAAPRAAPPEPGVILDRFLALHWLKQVPIAGNGLALLMILFPWSVAVNRAGRATSTLGLFEGGWFAALLAGAALYYTFREEEGQPLRVGAYDEYGHLALNGAGLAWSLYCLVSIWLQPAPAQNPFNIDAGATLFAYLHLLAWAVALGARYIAFSERPRP